MTTDIQLKTGTIMTSDEVKHYFEGIFAAEESGEQFPVNLDDVWPMAFALKQSAVREMRRTQLVAGEDYNVVSKNADSGPIENVYMLSVKATEHLIARRHKGIFEIYRQCRVEITRQGREKVIDGLEDAWLVRMAKDHVRHEREIATLRDAQIQQQNDTIMALQAALAAHQTALEAKQSAQQLSEDIKSASNYCTVVGYARRNGIRMDELTANRHSHILGALCRQQGIFIGKVPHEKWGDANTYPIEMLDNHFKGRGK